MAILLILLLQHSPDTTTATFLQSCQRPDGGYSTHPTDQSTSLGATSAALRALNYLHTKPQQLSKTKAYVWTCFDTETGQFRDKPDGKPSYRSTAVGVMAVVAMRERFNDADRDGVLKTLLTSKQPEEIRLGAAALESLIVDKQRSSVPNGWLEKLNTTFGPLLQADGSYSTGADQARATAGYSAAYLRLGYPIAQKDELQKLLASKQLESGGWSNEKGTVDLEASYRVMRCLYLLRCKDAKVLNRCEKFIKGLKQSDGGYALPGQKSSSVSATYFALSILHWLEELRAK
jgi:prenyltransferase beta subunit